MPAYGRLHGSRGSGEREHRRVSECFRSPLPLDPCRAKRGHPWLSALRASAPLLFPAM